MSDTFEGSVVIVTGASSGIGRAMAIQLAEQGAHLALAARSAERLGAVAGECNSRGAQTLVVPTDVTAPEQCKQLIANTVGHFSRLDMLVNNAGITMAFRFEDLSDLNIADRIIRVNYLGSVYCTHYALPHLKQSRGRIVGVASLTGKTGVPLRTLYAASKHAMTGFFDSLRIELMDSGISVTMIYPDFVQTDVRERALGPDGKPVGIDPTNGKLMTADDCARLTLSAAADRRRELIMGARGRVGLLIKTIAPSVTDWIARRAIERTRISQSRAGAPLAEAGAKRGASVTTHQPHERGPTQP